MSVWYSLESTCPVCSRRLQVREVGGCVPTGQDSDLLLRMEGIHIIQAAIHSCPHCRFSGYSDDFHRTMRKPQSERFLAEVSPKLTGAKTNAEPAADLRYYWAFRCAAFLSRPEKELAEKLVRAYWCLRLPPSCEIAAGEAEERRKVYLAGAIHYLRQEARRGADSSRIYLLAELNRRNGSFPVAVGYFKRFLDSTAASRPAVAAYLRLAAMKLLQAAEHSDRRDRTMEEIVYVDSPEDPRG